jgi:protocatechuate 3,4-dioxygenase alpha subunit
VETPRAASTPCIVSVAITGSLPRKKDDPAVPVTVSEQVESTHAAHEAGATPVHLHVRNDDETPTAPHVNLWVVARGINIGLHTRMYLDDEAQANAADPVLDMIEWEVRRKTLVARREQRGATPVYRFDIHLQGDAETVFFDV